MNDPLANAVAAAKAVAAAEIIVWDTAVASMEAAEAEIAARGIDVEATVARLGAGIQEQKRDVATLRSLDAQTAAGQSEHAAEMAAVLERVEARHQRLEDLRGVLATVEEIRARHVAGAS